MLSEYDDPFTMLVNSYCMSLNAYYQSGTTMATEVNVTTLETQMARMAVNLAYAYGNASPCYQTISGSDPILALIQPNVSVLLALLCIGTFTFILQVIVVVWRRAAFGALGSGLDVARTVAQSDYLQTATQGRCAEPDLDVPVALSFTPVNGAPGHIHFVMPGNAQPHIKGTKYGDR